MTDEPRGRLSSEQPWPEPGTTRFRVALDDADGDPVKQFVKDSVELIIVASEQPIDNRGGRDGLQYVVLPLSFPNFPIARGHAEAIAGALATLERYIANAQEDADTAIPTVDDGHAHVVRFARYSRKLPAVAICEICMTELVADVNQWAKDRGYVRNDTTTVVADVSARFGTIKEAIEASVNKEGGLSNG